MKLLIDKGSDVNVYCEDYLIEACQPIIYSVLVASIDAVKLLLKSGGDVNSKELGSGVTPLHISTNNGMKEMTEFLLENGGDSLTKTTDGRTPLDNAVKKEFTEIIANSIKSEAWCNIWFGLNFLALKPIR